MDSEIDQEGDSSLSSDFMENNDSYSEPPLSSGGDDLIENIDSDNSPNESPDEDDNPSSDVILRGYRYIEPDYTCNTIIFKLKTTIW